MRTKEKGPGRLQPCGELPVVALVQPAAVRELDQFRPQRLLTRTASTERPDRNVSYRSGSVDETALPDDYRGILAIV
ncbi:hypothetical protein [Streptomyces mirabilis]|uniref:hypothetical protein n=1 Tax=Streptomyces mirabilis TaxID=68239 RepID=UPI00332529E4